jgi:threonine dehydratase
MPELVEIQEIEAARERVGTSVHRTPTVTSRTLSRRVGAPLLLTLAPGARERGVVTISAGNHAQALAWAAATAGVPCTVVMPEDASRSKAAASRAYGAEVVLHGTVFEAFQRSLDLAEEEGLTFVHPFDDPEIVAGQGTAGLEIVEDVPDVEAVVVPVGGGGLVSGVAAAVKALRPEARIFGVEPQGADAMSRSLEAGEAVRLDEVATVADGLTAPMAGALTFEHVRELVDDVVRIGDDEIVRATGLILSRSKLLAEPAGAAGVAALLAGKVPLEGGPVVAVLSGGNVDMDVLGRLLTEGHEA